MKSQKLKMKRKYDWFDILNASLMCIFAVITIYPIFYVLIGAFSNGDAYMNGGVFLFPQEPTFANFVVVLSDEMLWYALRNTLIKTIGGTGLSIVFTSIVAYAMSRKKLKFKKILRGLNIFTMFFSGGLIPYFVLINYLNLYDNFLVYIIPSMYSVYNMIILSAFFSVIPDDLHEAAEMDGASEFTIWWKVYMPLAKPALATVALWSVVGHWNSYFTTMIYSNAGKSMITLQYYLMGVISRSNYSGDGVSQHILDQVTPTTVSYAAIILAIIPILLVYPFLQKYFTSGIQKGAIKG
jgi:putative aldouronate transport system permease protein